MARQIASKSLSQRIRDCGLTLVLLALFLLSLVGHALTGRADHNEERRRDGRAPLTLGAYLGSGAFQESLAENWESEFLQMFAFVWLTTFLYQRGSPESKEPGKRAEVDADPRAAAQRRDVPWPVRKGGIVLKLYEHSLVAAFLGLFLISFVWHVYGGAQVVNEEREALGLEPTSAWEYLASSRLWFESLQNWQSEFLSVAAMVYLTVCLRERGSPESKPVAASHASQG